MSKQPESITNNVIITSLMNAAIDARLKAYSPYSKFRVGAALLCDDGTVYTGCNVENSVSNLGICAERVTISKAISEGRQKFVAIAISSDMAEEFITPCGACRQFMIEFGDDYDVYAVLPDGSDYQHRTVKEFLPMAFTAEMLKKKRCSPKIDMPKAVTT